MDTPMLSPDRIPTPLHCRGRRRLRRRAPRHRPYPRPLARPAGHRSDRGRRRRHADRAASPVPPLGRADAKGVPAGADARPRAQLLRDSASVLDAAYEVGLSGPGRLHDLFVTHEAMSPGEWKSGGEGLTLSYGFHPSPFGTALVIATERGLAGLAFADPGERTPRSPTCSSAGRRRNYVEDAARTAPLAARIFDPALWQPDRPLRVVMIGTDFEVRVWETLLQIPMGRRHLFGHRRQNRRAEGGAGGRRGGRQKPARLRGAVPSRHRQSPATSPATTGA